MEEKKMIFSDFSDFPIVGNKRNWKMKKKMKMSMCIFFGYFQCLEQIINIDEQKKKNLVQ